MDLEYEVVKIMILFEKRQLVNITLRRFLHSHNNTATEISPKPRLCPTPILDDFNGSL